MSSVRPRGAVKAPKEKEREELLAHWRNRGGPPKRDEAAIALAGYEWFASQSHYFKQSYAKWVRTRDPQIKDAMWNAMQAEHRAFAGLPPETREFQSKQPWGSSSAGEELNALAILTRVKHHEATREGETHTMACHRVTAEMGLADRVLDDPLEAGRQRIVRLEKSFGSRVSALSLEHEVRCSILEGLQRAQVGTDCLYGRLIWAMLLIADRGGSDGKAYLNRLRFRAEDKARRRRRFRRRRTRNRAQGRDRLRILILHFKVKDLRAKVARYWAEHGQNLTGKEPGAEC